MPSSSCSTVSTPSDPSTATSSTLSSWTFYRSSPGAIHSQTIIMVWVIDIEV